MIRLDKNNKTIIVGNESVTLSVQQWNILLHFTKEEPLSVAKAAQRVYGSQSETNKTTTSVTLSRIKKLVGDKNFIVKARGDGYVIHPDVEIIGE
jgi:DNA-binding response OmpR family regulator